MSFIPAQEEYYNDIAVGKIYTRDEYDEETQAEVTKYFLETLGGQEVEIDAETYQDIADGKYSPGGGGGGGTVVTEEKTVSLDMANGDQVVIKSQNVDGMTKVTILKPNTLVANNIKKDVDIGGVVGDLEFSTEDKTVALDMASGDQQIDKSAGVDGMTQVTIEKPSSLTPENIKSGVDIGGVVGSYDPQPSLMPKTITQNGIYNAQDDGVDGYSSVDVNVSGVDDTLDKIIEGTVTSITTNASWIASGALQGMFYLETLNAPRASFVSDYAINFVHIQELNLPMCESILTWGVYQCSLLSSVSIPNCSYIGDNAFENCFQLSSIDLPSCEDIRSYAFRSCGISFANIPNLTLVGSYAFANCQNLSSISAPKIGTVATGLFRGCSNLSTAYLNVCSRVHGSAFASCYKLLSLYLLSSSYVTLSNINAFTSTPISNYTTATGGVQGSIYVPMSLLADYQATATTNRWSVFSSRFVGLTDEQIAAL